ncbi:purine-cytosine permease family protein [Zobellia galactanivorans]|uniref:purine-cytosine permease family protein n=1 Tax=Zobellia galactanivorans (strain DSM 12802 / CCUG 47099 / CIP 106680 / NCIMB 13871 / Dsij) TaxID=63186 RepID=UPI001C075C69|nr:cytosine permease [Zobellia galactanivorans]MBU3026852.1 cytosine permease [Zobellia galactanivorans]
MLKGEAQIADDYSRAKVPENKTVNGLRIASIIIGIGVTLPVFFVGSEVTLALGLQKAFWVFMGVCLILSVLCGITAVIGNRTRLSTYMLLHFSFGKKGTLLINFLVAITLLGWYAVTVEIFGQALSDAFLQLLNVALPVWVGIVIGSVLMTLTSIYGFRIIERFSSIAVPLMLLFVVYVLYVATSENNMALLWQTDGNGNMSSSQAISAVVGMIILTPVLMPDYSRFARTDKDSIISVLGLTIGFPLILLAGGIPTLITGEIDIMKIMISLSLTLPALFILIFSTWTTNTANLYSTQLTLSTVFVKTKEAKLGVGASIIGTVLALLGVATYFIDFLNVSSIFIPPVSAIFIADFFFVKKQDYDLERFSELPDFDSAALISWSVACVVAYLGAYDLITFTSISFFDSFIIAFALYLILKKIFN